MKKKKIIFIVIIALVSLLVYNNSSYYIKKSRWKTISDVSIGDFIEFENDKNDTYYLDWPKVFKEGEHVGYIAFCLCDRLWLYKTKDINDRGLGFCEYISK